MLNIIDLFCGCGGLSYGFERAGYNVLLGVDNDKVALKTFEKNHKDSIAYCGDLTKITSEMLLGMLADKKVDVIVGGPPCQGMSLSGPRKFDDPRNQLYLSFIRMVAEIKPRAFVIENVPGLVSLFKGKIKDSILTRLTDLGYNVSYEILLASLYGVPQNRKRVFFVGLQNEMFDFDKDLPRSEEIITTRMAIDDLPTLEHELGSDIMEYPSNPHNDYQKLMRFGSAKIYNHVGTNHNERVKQIIALVPDGGNYKDLPEELQQTRKFNVAWTRFASDEPSSTIDTGHRHHFHYKYNRVPTVRESARLQSFPDRFIFYGNKTQQYKQVGNAVPPLLAKKIASALKMKLSKEDEDV